MRHLVGLVTFAVVATSCAVDNVAVSSGDRVLDCADDQVVLKAFVFVSGDSEESVVRQAVESWLDGESDLLESSDEGTWSVVIDGRDVAVAIPELESDGSWVVHDVTVCGEAETGPAVIDGSLDCAGEQYWSQQAMIDAEAPGFPTPEEAIEEALTPYVEAQGGAIVLIDDVSGALAVDERENVVARAAEVPAGGWAVRTMEGCGDVSTAGN